MHFAVSWFVKPLGWAQSKVRRHYVDKATLLRDGAAAVTPAIQAARAINPVAASFGSREEIVARMGEIDQDWRRARLALQAYLNAHPSEEIRAMGHEAVEAVDLANRAARYLFESHNAPGVDGYQAYLDSKRTHDEAVAAMEGLMDSIRGY